MSEDIGPGDVVEAVSELRATMFGEELVAVVPDKARARVTEVVTRTAVFVYECCPGTASFRLAEYPLPLHGWWCQCGWRRVGGGQAESVKLFEGALRPASPARSRELEDG